MKGESMAIEFPHPFAAISNPRRLPDGQIMFHVVHEGTPATFVASPHDKYSTYGPLLFHAALAGEFGPLADVPEEGI